MKKIFSLLLCGVISLSLSAATFSTFNSRTDFRDESIYFLMTTRFYDGDSENNVHCWDAPQSNLGDPEWRGDFKGLIERLDYIKALGFTAIWMTPIVTNASGYDYHGYHAMDFSEVDKRYETHSNGEDVTFQDVVDAVHARGMKIILDIVLNHTGNFGESHLCPEFRRDWTKPQQNLTECMIPLTAAEGGKLASNYSDMAASAQYHERLTHMKNMDQVNSDNHNYYHHAASGWNWDEANRWVGQIAGDCVDLNTENPAMAAYLVNCYKKFIAMGVDGFRIDTSGHIARISFNNNFLPQFTQAGANNAGKRNTTGHTDFATTFFMFGEVCARYSSSICYRDHDNLSPFYYTWKESKTHTWDSDTTGASWDQYVSYEGDACNANHPNYLAMAAQGTEDFASFQGPTSQNALLSGNNYHTPDYSQWSGMSVIDFPMHWTFQTAGGAFGMANPNSDKYYNDATFNVVYVDGHDYGPDQDTRFSGSADQWAENMDLMFTYRGIPCIYYGSEVQFQAGKVCDNGTNTALSNTGRAYFGGYMTGSVTATDFGQYTATGNAQQTLNAPLAVHLRRLNAIRQAIPALRKGQYSKDGCSGNLCFKRRYTNGSDDSFVLVTISGNATFSGLPAGTYVDAITGDSKTIAAGGSLTTSGCSTQGNMRVYVLNGTGQIGSDEYYLYGSSRPAKPTPSWDGNQMATTTDPGFPGGGSGPVEPEEAIAPAIYPNRLCAFFNSTGTQITSGVKAHLWGGAASTTWPGVAATYIGNSIWRVVVPCEQGTPTKIIWSANGHNQTADLNYTANGMWNGATLDSVVTRLATDTLPDCGTEPEPEPQPTGACRIYYAGNFSAPYIWAWNAGPVNLFSNWPGEAMTRAGDSTYNNLPLWYYEFHDQRPAYCIFSNTSSGSNQTADLTVPDCGAIYSGNAWVNPTTAIEVTLDQMEARTNTGKIIINGRVYLIRDGQLYDIMGRKVEL